MSNKLLVLPHNSEDSLEVKAVPTDNNNQDEQGKVEVGRRNELAYAQVGGKNGLGEKLVASNNQISSTRKYILF